MQAPLIGINGAGIGGLAAAIGLLRAGFRVRVYEQAAQFARVGADINLTPNAVRALDGLGVGDALRQSAAQPSHRISRTWDSGEETSRLEMARTAQTKYGAPQLTMHRADLLQALEQAVPATSIALGKKLVSFEAPGNAQPGPIRLAFADGTHDDVDVLIGADGIHSVVRTGLFGPESPEFTGVVAYRAVVPADKLDGVPNLGAFTKWWGPNPSSQIVTFPLNLGRDIFVFATTPQDSWTLESWTAPGDVHELRAMYADYHPEARALLAASGADVAFISEVGAVCARSVTAMVARSGVAAGRCEPSDDAVHGTRRRHGDRRCCGTVSPLGGRGPKRRAFHARRRARALRGIATRTHGTRADRLARQPVAQGRRQCRLGLRVRRVASPARGLSDLRRRKCDRCAALYRCSRCPR